MSEINKDIEELLSCYIDGELSDRGCTEVKRLIRHDNNIAAKLIELQKQKQLLNNLPVEPAPQGLLQRINYTLSGKPAAKRYFIDTDHTAGVRHLFFRRVLTIAAMFILLCGLAVVVFNVIMPDPASLKKPVALEPGETSHHRTPVQETGPTRTQDAITDNYPFSATLELVSFDSIAVNSYIAKAIYNNGLVDNTIPRREATLSSYHITCTTDQIVALLADLEAVWDKCGKTSLAIYTEDQDSKILVNNITSAQAIAVFAQEKPDERTELARNFADFNALISEQIDGSDLASSADEKQFVPAVPIKPQLTRSEQQIRRNQPQTATSINMIITVTSL